VKYLAGKVAKIEKLLTEVGSPRVMCWVCSKVVIAPL